MHSSPSRETLLTHRGHEISNNDTYAEIIRIYSNEFTQINEGILALIRTKKHYVFSIECNVTKVPKDKNYIIELTIKGKNEHDRQYSVVGECSWILNKSDDTKFYHPRFLKGSLMRNLSEYIVATYSHAACFKLQYYDVQT